MNNNSSLAKRPRPNSSDLNKILVVGLCCVDSVVYVDQFPGEDTDSRAHHQYTTLGGNAANSCTVLKQFDEGRGYELFASVPKESLLLNSLITEQNLNLIRVDRIDATTPVSTVIVNRVNGSRTILHFRGDLPELNAKDFIDCFPSLDSFSWFHFEGRNFDQLLPMITYCNRGRDINKSKVSLELEKVRANLDWYSELIPHVDVIFMSKAFAQHLGYDSMERTVDGIIEKYDLDKIIVIVPWGDVGVAARQGRHGQLIVKPAHKPETVIDTLGAGDCFIGAALYLLNKRRPLDEVLEKACRVAGQKCGQIGLLHLELDGI